MFKTVEMYKTADGKLHETEDAALEHIANKCREIVAKRLDPLMGPYSANDVFRMVMALVPDAQSAKHLAASLHVQFC